jgi:flavin reductase (DIM6/NTAB) family NADH-FMN oxidoreductase RutF
VGAVVAATRQFDSRLLRSTLGSFASGVVIVSAAYEGREHGMTANSFTSVSLTPPLVLFCTHNDARMTRVLEPGMELGLSVLASEQQSVSRRFAGRGNNEAPVDFAPVQFIWVRGVPLIFGAVAHLVCRVTESRVAGDHTVQIAEVEHFQRFEKAPLVFWNGTYVELASTPTRT